MAYLLGPELDDDEDKPNPTSLLVSPPLLSYKFKKLSQFTLLIYSWISHHNFYSFFLYLHQFTPSLILAFEYSNHIHPILFKPKIAMFQKPFSGFPLFFRVSLLKPQSQLAFVFSRKFTSTFSVFFFFGWIYWLLLIGKRVNSNWVAQSSMLSSYICCILWVWDRLVTGFKQPFLIFK